MVQSGDQTHIGIETVLREAIVRLSSVDTRREVGWGDAVVELHCFLVIGWFVAWGMSYGWDKRKSLERSK